MTNQTKTRDSFILYRSFIESLEGLKNDEKLAVYEAISYYALDQKEPKLTGISKSIFTLIRPQLDANHKRYINGCKGAEHGKLGGRPKNKNPKITPKKPQNNPKLTPNDNDNVNENKNLNLNKNVNNTYQELAEGLKFVLEAKLNRSIKITNWKEDIRKLITQDLKPRASPIDDVKRCIQAIADNYGKEFFPVIQSAGSLREKFTKIENYLAKNKPNLTYNNLQNIDLEI